jgi:hypothetical protein
VSHRVADPTPQLAGDDIGIVLRAGCGRVDLVIATIRDDNPDVELHVVDHGDLVEVSACRQLRLTARSLRRRTGWDLGAHDVWAMIVSFHGTMTATADCVTVTSGRRSAT